MPTQESWNDMQGAMRARDNRGATRVLLTHGGRFLKAGTPVMVRDISVFAGSAEVTLQTGGLDMGEKRFVGLDCLPQK